MIRSLRGRVVVSLAAVTLAVLGTFVAVVFVLFRDRLRSDLDDNLRAYATQVEEALEAGATIPQPPLDAGQIGAAVITKDGEVLTSTLPFEAELESEESDDNGDGDSDPEDEDGNEDGDDVRAEGDSHSTVVQLLNGATEDGAFIEVPGEHGTRLRAFVHEIHLGNGGTIVATLAPASSSGSPANRLLVISLIALALAVLVVIAIAYWVGGFAVRPLRRLATEVHGLDDRSLERRVGVPEHATEVAEVAGAVNTLLSRIELSLQRERAFVADASHELRNPLASLRGELELSARDADPNRMRTGIEGAIEETDRLARLADDLLLLARADTGQLKVEPISLADIASSAIVRHMREAQTAGISLDLEGQDALALGAPTLVKRVLENLIENALRYAPEGTSIDVILWTKDTAAGIDVRDRGPGIPESDRDRIFDRFARADASRAREGGGTGLGLAIVASAMRAMDGSVELVSTEPGNTVFRLAFSRPT